MRSFAGIITIAIATAISLLTNEFTFFANKSLNASIEPTRPVAGSVIVLSRGEKLFTQAAFEDLTSQLNKMKDEQLIAGYSPVSIFNEGSFPIRNHKGLNQRMLTVTYWGVPYCSPLLGSELGLKIISGSEFKPRVKDGALIEGCESTELSINKTESGFAPRFGVIVNMKFLKKYLGINDKQLAELRKSLDDLPTAIKLEIPPLKGADGSYVPVDIVEVEVSGYVDDSFYPDLLFSEDVIKAYFLSLNQQAGSFVPHHLLHMLQHESQHKLIKQRDLSESVDIGYFPENYAMFNYVSLKRDNLTAYNMVVVHAKAWKTSGVREQIKSELGKLAHVKSFDKDKSKHLASVMRNLTTRADELNDFLNDDFSDGMAEQRIKFMNLVKPMELPNDFTLSAVASTKKNVLLYKLNVSSTLQEFEIKIEDGIAIISELPAWDIAIPSSKMTAALLKLKSIVDAYGMIMFWVVLMLASSASLLFTFSHILTKNRDISLFFTIGASKSDVFLIYLSQIIMIVLLGFFIGIALSVILSMGLEPSAREMLGNLFSTTNMSIELGSQSIFEINTAVLIQSFNWVFWAAALGATLPVAKATKTDPLSNQSKGM
jgi:hypothetical protein